MYHQDVTSCEAWKDLQDNDAAPSRSVGYAAYDLNNAKASSILCAPPNLEACECNHGDAPTGLQDVSDNLLNRSSANGRSRPSVPRPF